MSESVSLLSGSQFLVLYAALIVLALVVGSALARRLRPEGREPRDLDEEALAMLAGGKMRFTDVVVARALADGALEPDGERRMTIVGPGSGEGPAERALLAGGGHFDHRGAATALGAHSAALQDSLVERGLLLTSSERWRMRWLAAAPLVVVLFLGWFRRDAGLASGEPVTLLTAMMVLTAILAVVRFAFTDTKTRAGQDALAMARGKAQRLHRAPMRDEVALGVALFGTAILVGTPFAPVHEMRRGGDAGGGDGSSGCSDGGSGCGGGGCGGGCGGCGG